MSGVTTYVVAVLACMCVYVCMYVCMYVHMYVRTYVCRVSWITGDSHS